MENDSLQLSAFHEAGRVVIAYLSGYACDSMELPGYGSGGGSRLNSGNDIDIVQDLLSRNPFSVFDENQRQAILVARKLMAIYCAGSCTETCYRNGGTVPAEPDLEISGHDLKNIEHLQSFLKKTVEEHPEEYTEQTIVSVFKQLKDPAVWKAIELLVAKILATEHKTLSRFYIEDTLMVAGIGPRQTASRQGFNVGVSEDETVKPAEQEPKTSAFDHLISRSPLDIMLMDFLRRIKKDWKDGELDAAIKYLHDVYKKYGEN